MANHNKGRQGKSRFTGSVVGQSLLVGNPAATGMVLGVPPDTALPGTFMNLNIDDIDFFDKNPRRHQDEELYAQIKESIRATGVQQPVHVTRRPGNTRYILAQGGNTRLKIVKELMAETSNQRFATIPCIYTEYTSDENIHIAHLIENEQRADMVFWDKACAYAEVRDMLQEKSEEVLGLRKLEQSFTELGLSVSYGKLGVFLYAADTLSALGRFCDGLSLPKAADLRKQHNELLGQLKDSAYAADSLDAFWAGVLHDWHSDNAEAQELDVPALQAYVQQQFAAEYPISKPETRAETSSLPLLADETPVVASGNEAGAASYPSTHAAENTTTAVAADQSGRQPTDAAQGDSLPHKPVNPACGADIPAMADAVTDMPVLDTRAADSSPAAVATSPECPSPYIIPQSREQALTILHQAVHDLLAVVRLESLLLLDVQMPYGFLLDFPDFSKRGWNEDSEQMFLINIRHPAASAVFAYLWVTSGADALFDSPEMTRKYNPFISQQVPTVLDPLFRDVRLRDHMYAAGFGGLLSVGGNAGQMTSLLFNQMIEYPQLFEAVWRYNQAAACAAAVGLPDWSLFAEES